MNRVHGHLFRQPKSEGYRCADCGTLRQGKPFVRIERVVRVHYPDTVPLCPECWAEYMGDEA